MADHIKECDGTDCSGWECGMCEQCTYDFGTPEPLEVFENLGVTHRLCDLCMNTRGGRASPELQAICYVGNAILAKLDALLQEKRENES